MIKKKYSYPKKKPPDCVYPDCLRCTYRDCITDIVFPGETARNAECSGIWEEKEIKRKKKGEGTKK